MNKIGIVIISVGIVVGGLYFLRQGNAAKTSIEEFKGIQASRGSIQNVISTTGVVEPENRLEVKPSISGRIEEMLVQEGDEVKAGDVVAIMSSTERAALLDAAKMQGEEKVKYWSEVYRSSSIVTPIDGRVIVREVEPGQTITTSEVVVVVSDHLIVQANVDEVDIGGVKKGQRAKITLDAYPDISVDATVTHISYESTTESGVTMYKVDILPDEVPEAFRSGMSANVEIISQQVENALLLPFSAVTQGPRGYVVMVQDPSTGEGFSQKVEVGLSDDENMEIVSGLSDEDVVLVEAGTSQLGSLKKKSSGVNPFMPEFKRGKGK